MIERMELGQDIIDEIVRRVTSAAEVRRIILFGSAARGNMTADSDVDLLILENRVLDPWSEQLLVRKALCDMEFPFDIVIMPQDRFEETKSVIGGIAYPANKYGRVIYDAA